jgi:RNA polymerase sigma factor (sigma-70 family)
MARQPSSSPRSHRIVKDRAGQIAEYYAREAPSLERAVARTVSAPAATIEDACSHAWCQLLKNDAIELGPGGFWWLYVCAKREVFRLTGRARREPAGGEAYELPEERAHAGEDVGETIERRAEHDARLALVLSLSERGRQMIVLQAAGFSYEEIAQASGDSVRTVERQLLRGRRTLLRLQAATD